MPSRLSPGRDALVVSPAMSGHSKWSQIKRQKGAADVKRGMIFTKMTKEIMIAAKEGGGDPDGNFRLRLAMDRARAVNMPRDNIQRAIERATGGDDGSALESIVYEGYAPGGVSVMIEAATDNRNRTVSEIRAAFTRGGGKLGESGSVQWLFEQKGVIEIDTKGKDPDAIQLAAIDAGAEDVEVEPGLATVYTTPTSFERVKKALESAGIKTGAAELSMRPTTTVRVEGDAFLVAAPERALLLECGVVDVRASTTAAERLLAISEALDELIRRHKPFVLAVERLYFNKNVQTAMRVSEARGVALLCGARAGLEIAEYTPQEVKSSIGGSGRADKHAIQKMLPLLVALDAPITQDNVADAVAIALTHAQRTRFADAVAAAT